MLADEALSAGAARAAPGEPLARYVAARPAIPEGARVADLVSLVAAINDACQVPERAPTGLLQVP